MTFAEFTTKTQDYPLISSHLFPLLSDNPSLLRRQISEWVKKKWLIQLKRGMYIVTGKSTPHPAWLANQLITPSYISLEYALSHYRLIPERVEAITSITSKKTCRLQTPIGHFIYRHIRPTAYRMFVGYEATDFHFHIATAEKALLDYLYLNTTQYKHLEQDYFATSLRLQNTNSLCTDKLLEGVKLFRQKKLEKKISVLIKYIEASYD